MARKFISSIFYLHLFLFLAVECALAADMAETDSSTQQLESMTVVDEAESQRPALQPDSLLNPYRVEASSKVGNETFTAEDIKNLNPSDVYDLLSKATGVNITYQGRRNPFFVSIRGGGSFTYIIDGAVLPSSANRILYKFPVAAIEQMQIVRGSTTLTLGPSINIGSSSSGSGLNTGFIIIRTKQPQKTQAILAASMEKSKGGHPVASDESLYVGTDLGQKSNFNGYLGGMIANMNRPSKDSWFDGRSGTSGMANTGISAGKFKLNLMYYRDSGDFEMQRGVQNDGTLSDMKWYYDPLKTTIYSADMAVQWSPNQTTLLNLFKVEYDQQEYVSSFSSSTTTERDEYEEETRGLGLRHNFRWNDTLLQLGGQWSKSEGSGPNLSSGYNKYDTTVVGWSASVEQAFLDGTLVVDAGYRRDQKHIDNSSTKAVNDDANNDVDMAPADIIAAGLHWQFTDTYAFDGRYFYGDQGTAEDFDMLLQDGSDPDAEKQRRIELTLSADYFDWFRPAVTWFDVDIKNAKTATGNTYTTGSGTYYYYTQSDELRRGLEFLVQGEVARSTSYRVSWTRMIDNETVSAGVTADGNGTSDPKNLYSLMLTQPWRAYRFNLSVKKVDSWGASADTEVGGYTKVDANIQRDFFIKDKLLTVTLYGRNLGDKHYVTMYRSGLGGWPDRGLTVGAGFSLTF